MDSTLHDIVNGVMIAKVHETSLTRTELLCALPLCPTRPDADAMIQHMKTGRG